MHYAIVDFIADLVQNSLEAEASQVSVEIDETESGFGVRVLDDGKGMDEEEARRALDPFYTDGLKHGKRKVGLGLPFLKQATDLSGGEFFLRSEKGKGTEVGFHFDKGNVDCPPVGDLPSALLSILCLPGGADLRIRRTREGEVKLSYELDRRELAEALGSLEDATSLALLKRYLASQEEG